MYYKVSVSKTVFPMPNILHLMGRKTRVESKPFCSTGAAPEGVTGYLAS